MRTIPSPKICFISGGDATIYRSLQYILACFVCCMCARIHSEFYMGINYTSLNGGSVIRSVRGYVHVVVVALAACPNVLLLVVHHNTH